MIYMYLVNVTITNKVLYEALRDCYKMGFFREKADVAFESFADELTPVISRFSADEYTLKFSYTHTGNTKIIPQVPCDVLPCLLIQLRNLFAFTEEGFETFKTFLLERRREIDLSYDYVCWHIGNAYINEEPHRVEEYFYIDREKKKFWTTVEKYTGDISLNMGLATDQKDYEAELAKSEYSKNIADYPQNKMYGDPFAKVAIDLDKDVEIVDDKAPVKKEKSDDPIKNIDLSNKQEVIRLVNENAVYMMDLPKEYRSDRDVITAAIKGFPFFLDLASDDLKNDKELVLLAVKDAGIALKYASKEMRADKEVVLAAVAQAGIALQYASSELMADREVVLTAVTRSGLALAFASEDLRDDKEIVLAAVRQNAEALTYASLALQKDKDVIAAAGEKTE